MTVLRWQPAMKLGIPAIDADHKTLVGLFNFSPDPQHAHLNACNGILNAMDVDLQPYESQLIHL